MHTRRRSIAHPCQILDKLQAAALAELEALGGAGTWASRPMFRAWVDELSVMQDYVNCAGARSRGGALPPPAGGAGQPAGAAPGDSP
jgi:hypothetical protein